MQIIIIILCAYIVLSQILILLVGEYEAKWWHYDDTMMTLLKSLGLYE